MDVRMRFRKITINLRLTFAGTLDVFKSLSPTGERKPNSSLARVQEDQRRLLKMWSSGVVISRETRDGTPSKRMPAVMCQAEGRVFCPSFLQYFRAMDGEKIFLIANLQIEDL